MRLEEVAGILVQYFCRKLELTDDLHTTTNATRFWI